MRNYGYPKARLTRVSSFKGPPGSQVPSVPALHRQHPHTAGDTDSVPAITPRQ